MKLIYKQIGFTKEEWEQITELAKKELRSVCSCVRSHFITILEGNCSPIVVPQTQPHKPIVKKNEYEHPKVNPTTIDGWEKEIEWLCTLDDSPDTRARMNYAKGNKRSLERLADGKKQEEDSKKKFEEKYKDAIYKPRNGDDTDYDGVFDPDWQKRMNEQEEEEKIYGKPYNKITSWDREERRRIGMTPDELIEAIDAYDSRVLTPREMVELGISPAFGPNILKIQVLQGKIAQYKEDLESFKHGVLEEEWEEEQNSPYVVETRDALKKAEEELEAIKPWKKM